MSNDGYACGAAAAQAFSVSGCKIACICASDAMLAEAMAAAKALRAAGAAAIYLASPPGNMEPALRDAGIVDFAYPGANVPAILKGALAATL